MKLLRVVQEKTVRPVGESREETVDVRSLSAATHTNLSELVAQALFREELFYRINVIELRVPALRERPEDIPEIAQVFWADSAGAPARSPPRLGEDALELLKSYPFPGNVRELENVLKRALTLCVGGVITAEHIKVRSTPPPSAPVPLPTAAAAGGAALGEVLEEIEWTPS
ncbi:MAG: sigma 54-interacting transcriptional regulator [Terriglobales bacterium]